MHNLATFTTTDEQGQDVLLRAADLKVIAREHPNGSTIYQDSGDTLVVAMPVATLQTTINALWDEFTAALGDP